MQKLVVAMMLLVSSLLTGYEFKGQHFFASYKECDQRALRDLSALKSAFERAVRLCGATVLSYIDFPFEGNGLTAVFILSESHASIHTYPEHNACFVDLFTCGDHCSWEKFHEVLELYLKPGQMQKRVEVRS